MTSTSEHGGAPPRHSGNPGQLCGLPGQQHHDPATWRRAEARALLPWLVPLSSGADPWPTAGARAAPPFNWVVGSNPSIHPRCLLDATVSSIRHLPPFYRLFKIQPRIDTLSEALGRASYVPRGNGHVRLSYKNFAPSYAP